MAVLLHLGGAGGDALGLLIDRLALGVGEELVGHLHIVVVGLGAQQGDGQLVGLVVVAGGDLDGVVGAVAEGKVRAAPADRGVTARDGHIAGVEHMGVAQDDLQVRHEGGIVQRGGYLADTAADGGNGLAAGVGGGGLEAPGLGALAHSGVVPELLAGVIDTAVDGGGGQLDVLAAAPGAGAGGGAGADHVPEHGLLQLLGGGGRELHLGVSQEFLARLGGVQLLLHRLHIELYAHAGLGGLAGGFVADGGGHGAGDLVVERLHVHGRGGVGREHTFHGPGCRGQVAALEALCQLGAQRRRVHLARLYVHALVFLFKGADGAVQPAHGVGLPAFVHPQAQHAAPAVILFADERPGIARQRGADVQEQQHKRDHQQNARNRDRPAQIPTPSGQCMRENAPLCA